MIFYANPCTDDVRDAMSARRLGCIVTPDQGNVTFPDDGWDVIADNGCFSGRWSHDRWFRWLLDLPRTVRFVVAPDVFDPTGAPCHDQTLERWATYGPLIERHGFTPAFVCQVGSTPANVPDAPALFLGGTTEWKIGDGGQRIAFAHGGERWVHMGRVNSERRFTAAREFGCDSVDGTYLTYGPDTNLPKLLGWLERADERPELWGARAHASTYARSGVES